MTKAKYRREALGSLFQERLAWLWQEAGSAERQRAERGAGDDARL